jgi:hypothetical protein
MGRIRARPVFDPHPTCDMRKARKLPPISHSFRRNTARLLPLLAEVQRARITVIECNCSTGGFCLIHNIVKA